MQMKRYPIRTNIITGGLLAAGSDLVCQTIIERGDKEPFNFRRHVAVLLFGALYNGGICSVVYPLYSRMLPRWFAKTTWRQGLGSTLIDNGIHSPFFYIPAFFISTAVLQGYSLNESVNAMRIGYVESLKYTWGMWIPFQFLNFSVIPPSFRVLALSAGCFFYTCGLDYLSARSRVRGR